MNYTTLLNAIVKAELAATTFKEVSTSQDDNVMADSQSFPTLKNRIDEYLNYALPSLVGDDGIDVTNVYVDTDLSIIVEYSDGTSNSFTDIFPDDGYSIQGYSVDSNGVLIENSNKGDKAISSIAVDEALGISNLTVLPNANVLIEYTDGTSEEIGTIDFYAAKPFESTSIINDYLYYTLSDGTTNEVFHEDGTRQPVRGMQGFPGNEFSTVEYNRVGFDEVYLKFHSTDGTMIPNDTDSLGIGPVLTDVRIAQPEDVARLSFDDVTGQLDFYLPEVGQANLGIVHGADGADGADGLGIDVVGFSDDFTELNVTFDDGVTTTITGTVNQVIVPEGDTELIYSAILPSRDMIFRIGSPDIGDVTVNVGETRGKNGLTMDDINIDSQGEINVTVNNSGLVRTRSIGNIQYNAVNDVYLNPINRLEFQLLDGTIIIADGSPNGDDGETGPFIESVSFDEDYEMNLSVTLTNSTEFNDLGITRPTKSHYVERVGDDITYIFDDGSTAELGNLLGDPARNVVDVEYGNNELDVIFDNSDRITLSNIEDINAIQYTTGTLSFDYGSHSTDIPYTRPVDGTHGVWLTELREYSGGRLRAFYSNGTRNFLGGRSIHGNWPVLFYESNGTFYVQQRNSNSPTNIGYLKIDGDDGSKVPTNIEYRMGGDLRLDYVDGTTEVIPDTNNTWLTDIYNVGDDIMIDVNFSDSPLLVGSISDFGGSDGRWITNMRIGLNRGLQVRYEEYRNAGGDIVDAETVNIGDVDGDDGNWITTMVRDDAVITFERIYGSDLVVNGANAIDGIKARYVEDANYDGRYYTMEYNDQTLDIFDINGLDAKIINAFYKNSNGELVTEFLYHDDENYGKIDGDDFDDEVVNIEVDSEGRLVSEKLSGTTTTDIILRRFVESDLFEGNLTLTFNDVGDFDLGNVDGDNVDDGIYITNIEVVNQELFVDYSDPTIKPRESLGNFTRVDLATAEMVNGTENALEELELTLSDGSSINLGKVKGDGDSTNIVDGLININGILVLTRSDNVILTTANRIQGEHGLDIVESNISEDGDLVFTLSDDTEVNAGFVLQDLGFAPFSFIREYNRGESCTFDGNIYVALEDGVTSQPSPDNSQWAMVRLQDDGTFPDASKPEIISPMNDMVHPFEQPYLLAGELRNYYSVDERLNRIFQIDFAENNFINPIYEGMENQDGHQANITLLPNTEYKWRSRDIVETGYITDWSLEGTFTVMSNVVQQPLTSLNSSYDISSVPAMPLLESSSFNGSGTHTETVWEVKRNSDDKIVYSVTNNELNTTMVPFGILVESTDYSVRSKHISTTGESPFSAWFEFTTEARFTINFKPIVSFVGDNVNATTAKPYFKSNSFIDDFYDSYMDSENLEVTWQVRDSTDAVLWETSNFIDVTMIQVDRVMESGETFNIRVKYSSPRFFGESEWSEPVSFTPDWVIDTPIISTPLDITEYPVDGYFESNAFDAMNEEHFGSVWEIRSVEDDSVQHSSYNSFTALLDWNISFGERDSLQEYYAVVKHLGRYGESDWSDPLYFTMQEIVNVSIYITSQDYTVRRLFNEGNLAWLNSEHTDTTNKVAVDQNRNAYSVSNDNTLKKIDEFGRTVWTYTHDTSITSVTVYDEDNIIIGTSDNLLMKLDSDSNVIWFNDEVHTASINDVVFGTDLSVYTASGNIVRKFDGDGVLVWEFTNHSSTVNSVAVDINGNVYSGSSDNTVRKISDRGAQVWSFTGHSNNVNSVSVNVNFNVFSGSSDGTVRMIDESGVQVWSFTFGGIVTSVAADYIDRVYAGGNDDTVRMINELGEESWVYSGNTGDITDVTVNEIPVLMKPINLKGRYWNLVPPEDLEAF